MTVYKDKQNSMMKLFRFIIMAIKNVPMFYCFIKRKVSYGKHVRSYNGSPQLLIEKGARVCLGNNVSIQNHLNTGWYAKTFIHVLEGGALNIGNNTGLNSCMIFCSTSIKIGSFVNIGGGTRIYDTNFHDIDWQSRRRGGTGKTAPVSIGDDVFVGTGCIIGKGVAIGDRSVIAAGSVVVKDIPADCIAGGNPCKVIKYFSDAD